MVVSRYVAERGNWRENEFFPIGVGGKFSGESNPEVVTNARFMRTLARVLHKPFFLPPVPGFLLRLFLGEMANIALQGSRASAEKLIRSGFRFQYPQLSAALQDLLILD